MLVLSRHVGEVIAIGNDIKIHAVSIGPGLKVRIGIDAPKDLPVDRLEVFKEKQRDMRKRT